MINMHAKRYEVHRYIHRHYEAFKFPNINQHFYSGPWVYVENVDRKMIESLRNITVKEVSRNVLNLE